MSEVGIAKNIVERAMTFHLAPGDFTGEQELVIIRPRKLGSFSRWECYQLSGLSEPHEEMIPVLRGAWKTELMTFLRERRTELWVGEDAIERVAVVNRFVSSDKTLFSSDDFLIESRSLCRSTQSTVFFLRSPRGELGVLGALDERLRRAVERVTGSRALRSCRASFDVFRRRVQIQ